MLDYVRALLPAFLFLLSVWSLIYDDIVGAGGVSGIHYLPDLFAIAVAVTASSLSVSGSNPGWRLVFTVSSRVTLMLLAVDLGLDSYVVNIPLLTPSVGRVVIAMTSHAVMCLLILLIIALGPADSGASASAAAAHDWTESVRTMLTPVRSAIVQLGLLVLLVGCAISGFVIHCVIMSEDKFPQHQTPTNFFASAFVIIGYLGALLIAATSAFFFVTNSSNDLLEGAASALSALSIFCIGFAAGYWSQGWAAGAMPDELVAGIIFDAIVVSLLFFLAVTSQMSSISQQSYEPIGEKPTPPTRA